MKKIYLTLITVLFIFQLANAQWTTSGSNIYNSNTGNVGIGTTVPIAPLQVWTTHPATGQYGLVAGFGGGTNGNILLYTHNSGLSDLTTWARWNPATTRWEAEATTTVGSTRTEYSTNGSVTFYTQPLTAVIAGDPISYNSSLRILGNGNVGIGTTAPSTLLHVSGSNLINGIVTLLENTQAGAYGASSQYKNTSQQWLSGMINNAGITRDSIYDVTNHVE